MTAKKTVNELVSKFTISWLNRPLKEFQAFLEKELEKAPSPYRDAVQLNLDVFEDGYGTPKIHCVLSYDRELTEDELAAADSEKRAAQKRLLNEREQHLLSQLEVVRTQKALLNH